jgi:hypothetical protein
MRVYESVKNLPRCKSSPLFWLQYAIASLISQNFDRAKSYFEAAYSFAHDMGTYDSFQIDNHYARFLLERAIVQHDEKSSISVFRESRKLLFSQMTNERLHYPFRVAAKWAEFYFVFKATLTQSQKEEIKRAATFVIEQISKLPTDRQSHRGVVECWEAMHQIVNDTPKPQVRDAAVDT